MALMVWRKQYETRIVRHGGAGGHIEAAGNACALPLCMTLHPRYALAASGNGVMRQCNELSAGPAAA